MIRFDALRELVWDIFCCLSTSFRWIYGCLLNISLSGMAMGLGACLFILGLWPPFKIGHAFKCLGGMLFSRSAPCSATVGTLPEHGKSMVLHADVRNLPYADIPGLIWTWLWALKPLGPCTGTFRMIQFLHAVLRSVFIASIMAYQSILRPSMSGSCRFYPTCSIYAINAFCQHGLMTAIVLIVWRIIRCNPWGQCGYDPVPSSLFSSS